MAMTSGISIDVRGMPRPQGSVKTVPRKNGPGFATTYAPGVWEWRLHVQEAVASAMLEAGVDQFTGPVEVRLGFDLPRLNSHFLPPNSRRAVPELRPSAPLYPTVAPDLDKLVRCVCDAITDAGLWKDDAQVAFIRAAKRYATTPPGVHITVAEVQ
jgi:Holliday junction resolvase RusA-like endonuclease